MNKVSAERILRLAKEDVERIKKEARFFMEVNGNDDIVQIKSNPQGKIYVLAVIGPIGTIDNVIKDTLLKKGLLEKLDQEKFLLLEIGLRKGKPYRAGCDKERKNGVLYVPPRRKWFFLSDVQYCRIAPFLFQWLQHEASTRINNWGREPFLRRKKGFQTQGRSEEELLHARAGICFSASFRDVYLTSDILWASTNNEVRKRFLKWLCELSVKLLYCKKKKRKSRENLSKLLHSQPNYVIEDMLEFFSEEKKFRYLYNDIVDAIADLSDWDQKETEERRLRNLVLPNPHTRVGDIEMRIKRIDKRKGYIVFEVFSNSPF
ncbi:MAG: hypothetical protein AAB516_00760 [Patescibacteria group bacterium]